VLVFGRFEVAEPGAHPRWPKRGADRAEGGLEQRRRREQSPGKWVRDARSTCRSGGFLFVVVLNQSDEEELCDTSC
jgi:hypothetical protein